MPVEPNKNIEEQLRTFAKQRRSAAGAAYELPPTARRLLHDQVARTFAAQARENRGALWALFAALWPRTALAGGLLALFLVAVVYWVPKRPETESKLARAIETPPARPALSVNLAKDADLLGAARARTQESLGPFSLAANKKQSQLPESAAPPLGGRLEADGPARFATESLPKPALLAQVTPPVAPTPAKEKAEAAPPTALAAAEPPPRSLALEDEAKKEIKMANALAVASSPVVDDKTAANQPKPAREQLAYRADSSTPVPSAPAQSSVVPEKALQVAQGAAANRSSDGKATSTTVFFTQRPSRGQYRRNFNSPPPPAVLQSFQLEQSGTAIRVIDADGSVYEGNLVPSASGIAGESGRTRQSGKIEAPGDVTGSTTGNSQVVPSAAPDFSVTGLNRSLNQTIQLTGRLQNRGTNDANGNPGVLLEGTLAIGAKTELPIQATGTSR